MFIGLFLWTIGLDCQVFLSFHWPLEATIWVAIVAGGYPGIDNLLILD
jgi:hypothetical protein